MQEYIDRLVAAGIPLTCADHFVSEFMKNDDLDGLNGYVSMIENGYTVVGMGER